MGDYRNIPGVPVDCPGTLSEENRICRDCCGKRGTVYCLINTEDNLVNDRAKRFGEKPIRRDEDGR